MEYVCIVEPILENGVEVHVLVDVIPVNFSTTNQIMDSPLGSFNNPIAIDSDYSDLASLTFDISDNEESGTLYNPIVIDDDSDKEMNEQESTCHRIDYGGSVSGNYTPCSFDSEDEYFVLPVSNDNISGKCFFPFKVVSYW